jgi:hypothetical protein
VGALGLWLGGASGSLAPVFEDAVARPGQPRPLRWSMPNRPGPQRQRAALVHADHHAAMSLEPAGLGGAIEPQDAAGLGLVVRVGGGLPSLPGTVRRQLAPARRSTWRSPSTEIWRMILRRRAEQVAAQSPQRPAVEPRSIGGADVHRGHHRRYGSVRGCQRPPRSIPSPSPGPLMASRRTSSSMSPRCPLRGRPCRAENRAGCPPTSRHPGAGQGRQ